MLLLVVVVVHTVRHLELSRVLRWVLMLLVMVVVVVSMQTRRREKTSAWRRRRAGRSISGIRLLRRARCVSRRIRATGRVLLLLMVVVVMHVC